MKRKCSVGQRGGNREKSRGTMTAQRIHRHRQPLAGSRLPASQVRMKKRRKVREGSRHEGTNQRRQGSENRRSSGRTKPEGFAHPQFPLPPSHPHPHAHSPSPSSSCWTREIVLRWCWNQNRREEEEKKKQTKTQTKMRKQEAEPEEKQRQRRRMKRRMKTTRSEMRSERKMIVTMRMRMTKRKQRRIQQQQEGEEEKEKGEDDHDMRCTSCHSKWSRGSKVDGTDMKRAEERRMEEEEAGKEKNRKNKNRENRLMLLVGLSTPLCATPSLDVLVLCVSFPWQTSKRTESILITVFSSRTLFLNQQHPESVVLFGCPVDSTSAAGVAMHCLFLSHSLTPSISILFCCCRRKVPLVPSCHYQKEKLRRIGCCCFVVLSTRPALSLSLCLILPLSCSSRTDTQHRIGCGGFVVPSTESAVLSSLSFFGSWSHSVCLLLALLHSLPAFLSLVGTDTQTESVVVTLLSRNFTLLWLLPCTEENKDEVLIAIHVRRKDWKKKKHKNEEKMKAWRGGGRKQNRNSASCVSVLVECVEEEEKEEEEVLIRSK